MVMLFGRLKNSDMKRIKKFLFATMLILSFLIVDLTSIHVDASHDSLQGERIYQIMTDRFYDGDPSNNAQGEALRYQENSEDDMRYMKGGDWQGIIEKIPYIKGMGYTAIWISPIMDVQLWSVPDENGAQGPTAYHGYHIYDAYRANRYFGAENPEVSKSILKRLVEECHAHGLKVIIDVVPNHIGDYIKGIGADAHYSNATNYKPGTQLQPAAPFNRIDWYHNLGQIDWAHEHPHTEESTKMLENHDLGELDDLNFDLSDVKQAVIDANKYWFDYLHADYARVDAAKCMRPSDIHELQAALNVPTFGENFDMDVNFISKWVGDNGETGMLDFPMFQAIVNSFAHNQSFSDTIKAVLDQDYLYGKSANEMVTFIDNHDRNRFLTEAGGDKVKLQNALAFLFSVRGNPVVFQGTEQNRGNANGVLMYGMPDIWNRWSMVSRDEQGNIIKDYFDTSTDTYKLIAKLNYYRETNKALCYGKQNEMWSEPDFYAFSRTIERETDAEIICAFNKSNRRRSVLVPLVAESNLPAKTVLENIANSSDRISVSRDRKVCLDIPANSYKLYKVSRNQRLDTVPVNLYIKDVDNSSVVTGNIGELGNWDILNAVCTERFNSSQLRATFNCPVNSEIEFKFVQKRANGEADWETCNNHIMQIKDRDCAFKCVWSKEDIQELQKVRFNVLGVDTIWGESVYISGNIAELGEWQANYAAGPALCPNYPNWELSLDLPGGENIVWKALKRANQNIIWQNGNNHKLFIGSISDDVIEVTCNW